MARVSVARGSVSDSDEPVLLNKIPSHLESDETKVLREEVASKKRKVEQMEEEVKTLRDGMNAAQKLYDESAQVRRFHADCKHCVDYEEGVWTDVGTAITSNITVPAELTGNVSIFAYCISL